VCTILAIAGPAIEAQMFHNPARVEAKTFPVMAWGGAPSDPEQLKLMKEAG